MHGNLNAVRANSKSAKTKGLKALLQRSRSQLPQSGIGNLGGGGSSSVKRAASKGKKALSPLKRAQQSTPKLRKAEEKYGKDARSYELTKGRTAAVLGAGKARAGTEKGKMSPSAEAGGGANKAAKAKRRDELKGRRYNKGNLLPARWEGGVEGGVEGGGHKSERPSTVGPERKLHQSWSSHSASGGTGRRVVLSRGRLQDTWSYAHLESSADVVERQRKSVGFQL